LKAQLARDHTSQSEAITSKAIKKDKLTGWNNNVKECKRIEFSGKTFLLVEAKVELGTQFLMVDKDELTENAYKYLTAFVEGPDSIVVEDTSILDESSEEMAKLKTLINDLRADRVQLQVEIDQFR
jgi:hypothetical protein